MKKYRQFFPKSAFIVYFVVNVVSLAAIVFSSLKLADVGSLTSYYPVFDIVTIAVFVVFMILTALLLFRSYYAFGEEKFLLCRGLFTTALERDSLVKFVYDEASGVAALYFADPQSPNAARYVVVNLRKKDVTDFTDELRRFAAHVVVEYNPQKPSADA